MVPTYNNYKILLSNGNVSTYKANKQTNKQVAHHTMTNKFMGIYAFCVSRRVIMVLIVFYWYAMCMEEVVVVVKVVVVVMVVHASTTLEIC
jgi:hypothetical protein